jgi:hypothetical protein
MEYIYVVELYEDKWYIYFTTDSDFQYWECDENISEFIYHYHSIEINTIIPNCDKYDTDKYVKKYMKEYGLDNVRGGSYNNLKLTNFEKEFIQKKLDYIDIDNDKYNDKKKIESIKHYESELKKLTHGYWELIRPEEKPDSCGTKYDLPTTISNEPNIENIKYMINDDCVDFLEGPLQYNSDNSIKTYRVLIKFIYNDNYYEYRYKFSKKYEYKLDESALNDIKTRETDYKFILSTLQNL